jgi:hypothetical protein
MFCTQEVVALPLGIGLAKGRALAEIPKSKPLAVQAA